MGCNLSFTCPEGLLKCSNKGDSGKNKNSVLFVEGEKGEEWPTARDRGNDNDGCYFPSDDVDFQMAADSGSCGRLRKASTGRRGLDDGLFCWC